MCHTLFSSLILIIHFIRTLHLYIDMYIIHEVWAEHNKNLYIVYSGAMCRHSGYLLYYRNHSFTEYTW